eukprot:463676-Rhodomonas_salina.2
MSVPDHLTAKGQADRGRSCQLLRIFWDMHSQRLQYYTLCQQRASQSAQRHSGQAQQAQAYLRGVAFRSGHVHCVRAVHVCFLTVNPSESVKASALHLVPATARPPLLFLTQKPCDLSS